MHAILITQGVVLAKRLVGEGNTSVMLLTEELGLLRASARSARLDRSKLRYGLETLTKARFSLVRGKHEWRLTGVEGASRAFVSSETAHRRAAGRISKLLLRLINGEEKVAELYTTVTEGFAFLARAQTQKDAEAIECVLVLRILAHLGYLPRTPEIEPFIETDFFSLELAAQAAVSKTLLIRAINESLGATGL